MAAAIAHHGAIKCAIDIALHDLAGKRLGAAGARRCWASSGELPPTDFTLGLDEPAVVAERARRAADFPALKIKVGGAGRHRDARGGPRGLRRPDPGRREHRLDARGRARAAARARAPRRGAHRAAVPGPPPRPAALAPGALAAADRGRRERRDDRGPRRARRAWSPASTSSSRSAAASVPRSGCSSARGRSGSGRSSAAWRRRRSGSPPPPPSSPLAEWVDLDGCLLLAEDPVERPRDRRRQALAAPRRARPRARPGPAAAP